MAGKRQKKATKTRPARTKHDDPQAVKETLPAPADSGDADWADNAGPPVAGIGASAGGLDAFKKLFAAMPADSGIAFVLIPHLDPSHESLMPELLARQTRMPVVEAAEGMSVEANHIYILPPNKYMTIADRVLRLTGPVERHGVQTSIDLFLRSLAEDLKEKAIAIILSGTGSHGSSGLKAVKAAGGMAVVQDPKTAQYDRMPHHAVATGLADYVIPVEQMPKALIEYVKHYFILSDRTLTEVPDQLYQVLALLQARTKFDFRCYRKKMISRRIERRLSLNHVTKIDNYLAFLRTHPEEVKKLSRDLLISVTSFFRDAESYQILEADVIGSLVAAKGTDAAIRVWCAGCATGEEPYSVGMLILEQLAKAEMNCPVHIFATDVDEDALEVARQAIYPENISPDVSPERLARFFIRPDNASYQVGKLLREIVVFARQNLITDAPFSQLDLIVCRNLLIYLEPEIQKKVISLMHFALNDGGYLFLGPSETVGRRGDLFDAINKKWRIYRRVGPSRPGRAEFPITRAGDPLGQVRRPTQPSGTRPVSWADMTQRLLLEAFAPAAVLITRKCEILYYFGPTDRYLRVSSGEPTHDLLRLARDHLRTQLRAAIQAVLRDNATVILDDAHIKRAGGTQPITVVIRPVRDPKAGDGLLLVTFQDAEKQPGAPARPAAAGDESMIEHLEFELKAAREDLQSTVEEVESSNEELKASNEEVMSMNEEFQSANEELETSKEELQSLNEELSTVNSQLQEKLEDLEAANNDMDNLLRCTDIPTIFVDTALHIKRFTPATTRLFNLIAGDVGRPIRDIVCKFKDDHLFADIEEVIRLLKPHEKEIQGDDEGWWLRRVTPYRTADNHIEGAVITFNEVTQVKQADEQARRLAAVLKSSHDAIMLHDFAGKISAWNRGAEQLYGYSEVEALRMNIDALIPEGLRLDTKVVWERLRRGERVEPWESRRVTRSGQVLDVLVTATALLDEAGQAIAIAKTDRDISELKKSHAQLEQSVAHRTTALREREERLQAILDNALAAVLTVDTNGLIRSVNKAGETMFGYASAEILGRNLQVLLTARHGQVLTDYFTKPQGHGDAAAGALEVRGRRKDGAHIDLALSINHSQHLDLLVVIILDISRRKQLEHEVVEISTLEQQRIGQDLHDRCGQELTALGLLVDRLCADLNQKWPEARDLAVKVAQGIRRVLFQIRDISRGLARAEVESVDLTEALEELVARLGESKSMRCVLQGGDIHFAGTTIQATHLFHIAQEACTNALKHSGAKKIEVQLEAMQDTFTLRIRDDGVGVAADAREGLGQQIMRSRASVIGATLTIEPGADRGTVVTCTLKNFGRSNSDLKEMRGSRRL